MSDSSTTRSSTSANATTLAPAAAVNALPPAVAASTSGIGTNALVTFNWHPTTQLANFLADPAGATIIFDGDSTTLGFAGNAANQGYVGTDAMPAEVTAYLNLDGIAAQDDNFEGQGNELSSTPDARVTLLGAAYWSFPMLAGGELVATANAGDGVTFTPLTPTSYTTATISYFSRGGGSVSISVNGGPAFDTIALGDNNAVMTQTVTLPAGTAISSITATQVGATADYIQGIALSGGPAPAAQIYDLGVGGALSSIVGTGSNDTSLYAVTPTAASLLLDPTVAFINYGINDMLQGTLTAAQTAANIDLAVKEYQAAGVEPVIVIPQAIDSANYTNEIAALTSDIHAVALQDDVPVIDLSATYGTDWQALASAGLMADYAHPDGIFYSDIAKGIAGLLADASAACYAAGTLLLTPRGAAPIEQLQPGDAVVTVLPGGPATQKIIWTGQRRIDLLRHADPDAIRPVIIRAGALAPGVPERDLRVSPHHAMYLEGALYEALALVNGMTILRDAQARAVTYHHIELATHSLILAEGCASETYLDTGNRHMFTHGNGAVALHPTFRTADDAPTCAPLIRPGAPAAPMQARLAARGRSFTEPAAMGRRAQR